MSGSRLVCPHCGEYAGLKLVSITDVEAHFACLTCKEPSVFVRENEGNGWRVREEKE